MRKTNKQHNAQEVIKIGRLTRLMFSLEFKAEVVRHKRAELED